MTLQESAVDVFGGPRQPKKAAEPDLKVVACQERPAHT